MPSLLKTKSPYAMLLDVLTACFRENNMTLSPWANIPSTIDTSAVVLNPDEADYDRVMAMLAEIKSDERDIDTLSSALLDKAIMEVKDDDARLIAIGLAVNLTLKEAVAELNNCSSCPSQVGCSIALMCQAFVRKWPSKGVASLSDSFEVRLQTIREVWNNERPSSDMPNQVFSDTIRSSSHEEILAIAEACDITPSIARAAISRDEFSTLSPGVQKVIEALTKS